LGAGGWVLGGGRTLTRGRRGDEDRDCTGSEELKDIERVVLSRKVG